MKQEQITKKMMDIRKTVEMTMGMEMVVKKRGL